MSATDIILAAAGSGGDEPLYIDDTFSCFLYTGNGSTQTISNGIDLAGEGGLTWIKLRSGGEWNHLFDTERGATKAIFSNTTDANNTLSTSLTSFNSNGFSLGSWYGNNGNTLPFASWTFREAPKFFDVVTYTGNGVNGRDIAHSLQSTPKMIIVKRTDNTSNWMVAHLDAELPEGGNPVSQYLNLNNTNAADYTGTTGAGPWAFGSNSDTFYVWQGANASSATYVAYLFAHDAGGFGAAGTDNVISCGSFTAGSSGVTTVNLGFEPQYLMYKASNTTGDWGIVDVMRGFTLGITRGLYANTSGVENNAANASNPISPTATGFIFDNAIAGSGNTYIYMAIRRPMKPPTSGTQVFYSEAVAQADIPQTTSAPFPPDLVHSFSRNGTNRTSNYQKNMFTDRLRSLGTPNNTFAGSTSGIGLVTNSTDAELDRTVTYLQLKADSRNITRGSGFNSATYGNYIFNFFRRATGFFDVVCFTSASGTQNHNLGVSPELVIMKTRDTPDQWYVFVNQDGYGRINQTAAWTGTASGNGLGANYANVTSTTFSKFGDLLGSASLCVAYLFASIAGVSKVGSYTGTGGTQTINAALPTGARFVMIKRTDSTGSWWVWDTARGMVSGTDPRLAFNSTAAELNDDWVYTVTNGFQIVTTDATVNASGGSYIYLAIA